MINFKTIEIEDKKWIDPLLVASDLSGCHQNFGNLFAWSKVHKTRVAKINDYLVVKGGTEINKQGYFYPAGSGTIQPVIEEMIQDAADCGHDFILNGISPENMEALDILFPGQFSYEEVRDAFDYVYLLDKMVSLSGKKLHRKRNHINQFKKNHQWSFEPITLENLQECWEMNEAWCKEMGCSDDNGLKQENCATRQYFKYFSQLKMEGGLLRSGGQVIAYTMGEILNSDTYVIHLEKAFRDIQGAYPMINREFAAWIKDRYPHIVYVNREEDVGDEGLRKAKQSYYPDKMEEKYTATYQGGR
ncbi:MAG: DUF2156 domain-containing protein [Epulopiscium sp.]|nr:DUF2156 domain-containing protein [Candidatus Epulonipiscium sp.]